MRLKRILALSAAVTLCLLVSGCSSGPGTGSDQGGAADTPPYEEAGATAQSEATFPRPIAIATQEILAQLDARATSDAATATASGPVGRDDSRQVAMVSRSVSIIDVAGSVIGAGEVRVFAPPTIQLGETSEVRVEIQTSAPIGDGDLTLNPRPSPTPQIGTPRPTPSPLPEVETQYVEIHEIMGAQLSGVHAGRFFIHAVPPDGLRRMHPQVINWWKWNISPRGPEALGRNQLEIVIYLPLRTADGTPLDEPVNTITFTVEVVDPGASSGGTAGIDPQTLAAWIGILTGAAALVGGTLTVMRFLQNRSERELSAKFRLDERSRLEAVGRAAVLAEGRGRHAAFARRLLEEAGKDESPRVRAAAQANADERMLRDLEARLRPDTLGDLIALLDRADPPIAPRVAERGLAILRQIAQSHPDAEMRRLAQARLDRA